MTGDDGKDAMGSKAVLKTEEPVSKPRTIHPYDLSAIDNPGLVISQVLLNGDNFEDWPRELRTALRARKKFGFVDGSITRPAEGSGEIEDWWTINSLLVSWIQNTIDLSLRRDISHFEIAKELWDDIADQYGVVSGPRIQQLKHELVTCKQRGLNIKAYYGKLKRLWEDLSDYDKEDQCICNDCSCDSKGRGSRKREKDKVHQFFMGLDETTFGALKSSLLTRNPLPTLNQAFSTVQRDETMRLGNKETEVKPEVVGFAVQTVSRGRVDYKDKICSICGKKGHGEERCYARIGYPVWWKGTRIELQAKQDNTSSLSLPLVRKPVAHAAGPVTTSASGHSVTASPMAIPGGFTEEQCRTFSAHFTPVNQQLPKL